MANELKKFLTIRNWSKFQSTTDSHGRSLEGRRRTYVLDYTEKETDSLYVKLTMSQRYMIDACRRLRGRLGLNIPNDAMWICRQLEIDRHERGKAVKAIVHLIDVGFLIPTDEERITAGSLPGGERAVGGSSAVDERATDVPEASRINNITSPSNRTVSRRNTATVNPTVTGERKGKATDETETDQQPNHAVANSDWREELQKVEGTKYAAVLSWMDTKSSYWKGKPLRSLKAYRTVESQYDKFYAKLPAGKKPHELPVEAGEPLLAHSWTTKRPASVDGRECCSVCGIAREYSDGIPCEHDEDDSAAPVHDRP